VPEERASRPRPAGEGPMARLLGQTFPERKRRAPKDAGSSCSEPRLRQRLGRQFRPGQEIQRWPGQRQRSAEPRPAKADAEPEVHAARPRPAEEWPTARLLERPCLESKRHAQKGAGSSCSSSQQRQGLGHPLPAMARKARRLAARKAAARRDSSPQDRLLGLARTSRWRGASDTPRPAGRREARPQTPLEGRRP
jgi:hypothetical protein